MPSSVKFISSMECLPVTKIPEGNEWTYEIKLDGYRFEAIREGGKTALFSRREDVLNQKFPYIAAGLDYPLSEASWNSATSINLYWTEFKLLHFYE